MTDGIPQNDPFGGWVYWTRVPLASVDRSRSASNLLGFGLHRDALISSLALFGISPFDTRSKNLFVNFYRLGLYALLLGCLALAAPSTAPASSCSGQQFWPC